jgi:hypothetical protein
VTSKRDAARTALASQGYREKIIIFSDIFRLLAFFITPGHRFFDDSTLANGLSSIAGKANYSGAL